MPQKPRFSPNAGFAIRPSPPIYFDAVAWRYNLVASMIKGAVSLTSFRVLVEKILKS